MALNKLIENLPEPTCMGTPYEPKGIGMTVMLPMYRARSVSFVALESLIRQKWTADEAWELVVCEEQNDHESGLQAVIDYGDDLIEAGCERVVYQPLDNWIPLSWKWLVCIHRSSNHSGPYALQAADCYSGHLRLQHTYDRCPRGNRSWWFCTSKGRVYDPYDDTMYHFDWFHAKCGSKTGMNIAFKHPGLRSMELPPWWRGIDNLLMKTIMPETVDWLHDPDARYTGISTCGQNHLSTRDHWKKRFGSSMVEDQPNLDDYRLSVDVQDRLRKIPEVSSRLPPLNKPSDVIVLQEDHGAYQRGEYFYLSQRVQDTQGVLHCIHLATSEECDLPTGMLEFRVLNGQSHRYTDVK